ncbi:hypothetical protein MNBD_GAMMA12-294 [hydrothermal vent metagenome]|uniref:Uncharacterized protein n=1 Tax=hydrothermal vent metagenome TaxID=652676 RepID=A0A3B0Y5H8_9ZZZZ
MHPLISIISFIICAISLSLSVTLPASLITFCLCIFALFFVNQGFSKWRTLLWRLRWFWLSITVLYIGFTPGEAVWPTAYWSPSFEGFRSGLMRVLILIDIFTLVFILHNKSSREKIVAGLHSLCWPLQFKSGLRDKLVLRLLLTFEYVDKLQGKVEKINQQCDSGMGPIDRMVTVLQKMINESSFTELSKAIIFKPLAYPRWYEWAYPLGVALIYELVFVYL